MNRTVPSAGRLRWQSGYAAFSLSREDVAATARYVLDQKIHHGANRVLATQELLDGSEYPGDD